MMGCRVFIWVMFFCLISACKDQSFYEFDNVEVAYQIYPAKDCILRTVEGDGAPFLQLFDTSGNHEDDISFKNSYPFAMTNIKKDSIEISFIVTKDYLKYFLKWFNNDKNIPKRLRNFKLNYTYIIDDGSLFFSKKHIDSLSLVEKDKSVTFFEKGKLLDNLPIYSVRVNVDSFDHLDYKKNVVIEYNLTDTTLIDKFMKGIPLLYKSKD